jgi:hypothetical protein
MKRNPAFPPPTTGGSDCMIRPAYLEDWFRWNRMEVIKAYLRAMGKKRRNRV